MDYVEIEGDEGQRWRLRYTNRAFRWLETQLGVSFQELLDSFADEKFTFQEMTTLVAGGLLHENRDVGLEDADDVLDAVGYEPTITAVAKAIELSSFSKGSSKPQQGTAPKNGSGTGTSKKRKQRTSG